MTLVTVDRGNTTLDVCVHGGIPRRERLDPGASTERLRKLIDDAEPVAVVMATVVAGGLDIVHQAAAPWPCHGVPADLPVPLPLTYDTPETLGVDRWLAACGAADLAGGDVIVVDCGTATTVNAVRNGAFCGGSIGPGLDGIAASMADRTPALPAVDVSEPDLTVPARSTQGAVDVGAVLGWCGGIERIVAGVFEAMGPSPVFVTGGRAAAFVAHANLEAQLADDLVHRGLRRAWEAACGS